MRTVIAALFCAIVAVSAQTQQTCGGRPVAATYDARGLAGGVIAYVHLNNYTQTNATLRCNPYTINNGVWVQLTNVPIGYLVTFSTCTYSNFDTIVGFYANCELPNGYPCAEDSCGLQSEVRTYAAASTMWVYAGSFRATDYDKTLGYSIHIAPGTTTGVQTTGVQSLTTGFQGQFCGGMPRYRTLDMSTVTAPQTFFYNIASYYKSSVTSCVPYNIYNGIWVTLDNLTPGYRVSVSTCGTSTVVDTVMGLYPDCNQANRDTGGPCVEDSCGLQSNLTFTAYSSRMYVLLGTYSSTALGNITFVVSNTYGAPPPPTTSVQAPSCQNRPRMPAIDTGYGLFSAQYSFGSTQYPRSDARNIIPCDIYTINNGIWVPITNIPAGYVVNVTTCGQGNTIDTIIGLYAACTARFGGVCAEDTCGIQSSVQETATEGTLYLHIGTFSATPQAANINYTISVINPLGVVAPRPTTGASSTSGGDTPSESSGHGGIIAAVVAVIFAALAGGLGFYIYRMKQKQARGGLYSTMGLMDDQDN